LVLFRTVSEILQVFVLMTQPYSTIIWAGTSNYSAVKLFLKYSNLC